MKQPATNRTIAAALSMRTEQVREIANYGTIRRTSRRRATKDLLAIELGIGVAGRIWGDDKNAGHFRRYAKLGKLKIINPGERHHAGNPRRVTVAAILDLLERIGRRATGY